MEDNNQTKGNSIDSNKTEEDKTMLDQTEPNLDETKENKSTEEHINENSIDQHNEKDEKKPDGFKITKNIVGITNKNLIIDALLLVFCLIFLVLFISYKVKYDNLNSEFKEVSTTLENESGNNDELSLQVDNLIKEKEKLSDEVDDLNSKIDELKNGASARLVKVKNAFDDGKWQDVIDLSTDLHNKYNGSVEDKEAQELATQAQQKIDEVKAQEAAEEAKGYETGITYDQLARTPNDYRGKKIKFYGKVIQVLEDSGMVQIRLAVNDNYDTVIFGWYQYGLVSSRVLENDEITVYGISEGTITYDSTMGGKITIPGMSIKKIDQ